MTIWKDHAWCDGCPKGGEAVTHIMEPWFDRWARIEMQSGGEAHLCPSCQRKRDRGWLGHDYVIECIRCGRNSVDNPEIEQWWGTHDQWGASVCGDCYDPKRDWSVPH